MIAHRFHLKTEEIDALEDETFLDLAAKALVINELETEIVRDGVLKAYEAMQG